MLRRIAWIAWAWTIASCGAGASTTREEQARERTARVVCEGSCREGDACTTSSIDWQCTCAQRFDVNCGGAPRELAPPTWQWACAPIDPRSDRGDGCPFAPPEAGTACTPGAQCRYPIDECGWHGRDAACVDGAWALQPFVLPPPP